MKKLIKNFVKSLSLGALSISILWVIFLISINNFAYSQDFITMPNGKTVVFLNKSEGYEYIRNARLIDNISKLDIELRLEKKMQGKDLETCKKEYAEFIKTQILDWKGVDKRFVTKRLTKAYEMIEEISPNVLQDTVYMILATGKQEFDAFYTLKDAIVCPKGKMRMSSVYMPFSGYLKRYFNGVMIHELFHIFSTNNPKIRLELYESIGFESVNKINFLTNLSSRIVYNPDDKPGYYKIKLKEKNSNIEKDYCMLILSKYHTWEGHIEFKGRISTLLVYLDVVLHQIEFNGKEWVSVCNENGNPVIKQKSEFEDFYLKTGYDSYSPEEIVAHLFIDLIKSKYDNKTLENKSETYRIILDNMEEILK